ncbi:hypothetical protein EVAR_56819_1 [Eumeta japonica]|uniref:Uncharacterized protein n=1 Tax=Eumeta variegata TaxID=151549 RepID=A0A4C1Y4F3_EUMVA|nr:hypothetical protein EVAR_56819_1 [Eumeta japonica]
MKLASTKLGGLNITRQYFKPDHRLSLCKTQVRPQFGVFCRHLWAGALRYQLLPLDRLQLRASRNADDRVSAPKNSSTSFPPRISVIFPLTGSAANTILMVGVIPPYASCAVCLP